MNLETIACNQCGAPLSVPEGAKFVTCNHCHANLAVRRNDSVRYTEMVEKIAEHTANLAEQVAHLRYQNELERIDREWQHQREMFMITDKNGARHEPTEAAGSIVFVLVIAFGIFWTLIAGAMFPHSPCSASCSWAPRSTRWRRCGKRPKISAGLPSLQTSPPGPFRR